MRAPNRLRPGGSAPRALNLLLDCREGERQLELRVARACDLRAGQSVRRAHCADGAAQLAQVNRELGLGHLKGLDGGLDTQGVAREPEQQRQRMAREPVGAGVRPAMSGLVLIVNCGLRKALDQEGPNSLGDACLLGERVSPCAAPGGGGGVGVGVVAAGGLDHRREREEAEEVPEVECRTHFCKLARLGGRRFGDRRRFVTRAPQCRNFHWRGGHAISVPAGVRCERSECGFVVGRSKVAQESV
mmetsp:Transcript_10976/g.27713  ORF Transcript_10976/g.27713 Transcript_10976/m.27713 type:complete len:245 (-) Transcript_10976:683-1417(-)